MDTDFRKITPCGGDCGECEHFKRGACEGCLKNGGKCVHMWEKGCKIFACCEKHNVKFCGLCGEFPCDYVKTKITGWDGRAVERLKRLGAEYRKRETGFSEQCKKLWKQIGTHGVTVLSTCAENRVTSRPMSVVVIDGKFYFQTDENYLKFRQLAENENAALSVKNFSVEGKCRSIGRPDDNEFFVKALKKYFLPAYMTYSKLETERVLEFVPTLIYSWSYELAKPYMEYWDFENLSYKKECKL